MSDNNDSSWIAIRDLFDQIITPAKDWQDAQLIADTDEMLEHFHQAFPDIPRFQVIETMRMALHDLNIPYERNEHNNKYYYLAKWKN